MSPCAVHVCVSKRVLTGHGVAIHLPPVVLLLHYLQPAQHSTMGCPMHPLNALICLGSELQDVLEVLGELEQPGLEGLDDASGVLPLVAVVAEALPRCPVQRLDLGVQARDCLGES